MLEAIEDYQKRERRYGGLGDGADSDDISQPPLKTLVPR
jgi:undecaprenyl diphosphate synthase